MMYENLDDIASEIEKLSQPVQATLEKSREELITAKCNLSMVKSFNDLEKFARSLQQEIDKSQDADKITIANLGIAKLIEYVANEQMKLHDKVVLMSERVAVLESVVGHTNNYKSLVLSRKEAIERVLENDGEQKRPERIAVIREAEKVKKSRKQDT